MTIAGDHLRAAYKRHIHEADITDANATELETQASQRRGTAVDLENRANVLRQSAIEQRGYASQIESAIKTIENG